MRLTFFGTSHGVPEPGRKCSTLLVTVGENRYFIDMGGDAAAELVNRNISFDSVKAVFISHPHGDHTNGLINFVDLLCWYFKTADPEIFLPDGKGAEIIREWCTYTGTLFRENLRFNTVKSGAFFDDGVLKVTAIPTKHSRNSAAFLLEGDGKRVLYTGDLKATGEDFPQEIADEGLDCLIGECAHLPITRYLDFLKGKPVKQAIITHHYLPKSQEYLSVKKELSPLPFTLANDGMEFEI